VSFCIAALVGMVLCHDSYAVHTAIIIIVLKLVKLFHVVQQIGSVKLDASPNPDQRLQVLTK
jgi:hypothetical protein